MIEAKYRFSWISRTSINMKDCLILLFGTSVISLSYLINGFLILAWYNLCRNSKYPHFLYR